MAARKRKAAKRELINTGGDKRYVRRKAGGRFGERFLRREPAAPSRRSVALSALSALASRAAMHSEGTECTRLLLFWQCRGGQYDAGQIGHAEAP